MTRKARHLLRMRRLKKARRTMSWTDGLRVGIDMAIGHDQSVTLVYRGGKWERVS